MVIELYHNTMINSYLRERERESMEIALDGMSLNRAGRLYFKSAYFFLLSLLSISFEKNFTDVRHLE